MMKYKAQFLGYHCFRLLSVLAIGVLALVAVRAPAAAASPESTRQATQVAQLQPLKLLLDFTPNAGTHTFLFVARDKGFYREAGLDLEFIPGKGSSHAVRIVGAGRAPLGLADAGTMSIAVAQDVPVHMVAVLYQKTPVTIFSLKEKNIIKPKDLEGKTFGVAAGMAEAKIFPAFARKNNLDLSKIKIIQLSFPTRIPSLINGQVDTLGAFVTEEQNITPHTKNGVNAIKVANYGVESYGNGIIVNNDFAAKNPGVVERFVQASLRGLQYSLQNPDEALEITLKALPHVTREAAVFRAKLMAPFFESETTRKFGLGWMEDSIWKATQKVMVEFGGQTKAVDLRKLYTNKYLK